MNQILILVFLGTTVLILLLGLALSWVSRREKKHLSKRIKQLDLPAAAESTDAPLIIRDEDLSQIPALDRLLRKLSLATYIKRLIEQAGYNTRVSEILLFCAVLFSIGVLIALRLEKAIWLFIIPPSLSFLPILFFRIKRSKRLRAFIRQFPDAIDMMVSALKAGHAFNRSMQLVAIEAPDPLGIEFKKVFEENSLGVPLHECLVSMTQRIESEDLKLFITAVLLQRETGGNLTEILSKISYTIRERFKLMGKIRALTAQGRMSAWVLGLLPVFLLLLISLISPSYIEPLFTDPIGRICLAIGFVNQIIGVLWIKKIVEFKMQ